MEGCKMEFEQNNQENQDINNLARRASRERSRSRSPVRRSRSRSRSPRDWKRSDRDRGDRRRDSGRDGNTRVRLYICNIPFEIRWQDLKDLFRGKLGQDSVTYVELYEGHDGKPTGHGVIEVRGRETADKAIDLFHRFDLKGRQIVVREEREKDRIRHEREKRENERSRDGSVGGGSLMGNAAAAGGSILGNMGGGGGGGGMMPVGGGGGGGMMSSGGTAQGGINISLQMLQQLEIDPTNLTAQVFVANLDYKVTDRKLKDIFRIAGNVVNCELKKDKEGKSRGMGIVRFEHAMEAVQAIAMFHNQPLYERTMAVRMDKMGEVPPENKQFIPNKIPAGLKTVGLGLGTGGSPLQNVSQIANALCLTNLTNLSAGGLGNMASNMMNNMGGNMGTMGNAMGNMGGMGGMANMGGNMGGGMGAGMGSMGNQLGSMNSMGGMGGGMGNAGMGSGMGGGMGMGSAGLMGNMGMGTGSGMGGLGGGGSSGLGDMGRNSNVLGGSGMGSTSMGSSLGGSLSGSNMGGGGMGMGDSMGGMGGGGMGSMGNLSGSSTSLMGNNMGMGGGRVGSRSRDMSSSRDGDSSSVFVRNLPFNVTWQTLKEKFRDCGEVRYSEVKMENGRSKGYGVVKFNTSEDARRAVNLMNGARIEGRQIEVRLEKN